MVPWMRIAIWGLRPVYVLEIQSSFPKISYPPTSDPRRPHVDVAIGTLLVQPVAPGQVSDPTDVHMPGGDGGAGGDGCAITRDTSMSLTPQ